MKRKRGRARWLLVVLRTGLCVAALAYLVRNVPWHDRVRLDGRDGPLHRVLEYRDDAYVIDDHGTRTVVGLDRIHRVEIRGAYVPDVELGIPSVVLKTDRGLALLSILVFLPSIILQAFRLRVMVAIQQMRLSWWNATKLTFVGNFFNFALPGTTGGDLVKAYYLSHYTHRKTEVVTTVFIDRAIGLLGIVVLAAVGILLTWDPAAFSQWVVVLVVVATGLFAGSVLIFSRRLRAALGLAALAARLPLGEQILRIGRAVVAMREHKRRVASAISLTLVLQIIVMISAAIMAWALDMRPGPPHVLYYLVYVAIGFLIAAVPIFPPQAFGVMEYFYVLFFTQSGENTASQAVALALAVRLIQLVWALGGVLVPLFGAHLPSQAELEVLEQEAAAATTDDAVGAAAVTPAAAIAGDATGTTAGYEP